MTIDRRTLLGAGGAALAVGFAGLWGARPGEAAPGRFQFTLTDAQWRRRLSPAQYATLRHAEDEAGRFAGTLEILQTTRALERGLSVAVLVQKNSTAAELADTPPSSASTKSSAAASSFSPISSCPRPLSLASGFFRNSRWRE